MQSTYTNENVIYRSSRRAERQGRINQYANNAIAWGPPVQGGPLGGTNFFNI